MEIFNQTCEEICLKA